MVKKKPVIGILLDTVKEGSFSSAPHHALRHEYSAVIGRHGGVPLLLPHEERMIHELISCIDGLMIPGSDADFNPSLYGQKPHPKTTPPNDKRDTFFIEMAWAALKADMPVLGICAGIQLLNIMFGGSLVQHIPEQLSSDVNHQPGDRTKTAHRISIEKNSVIYPIIKKHEIDVNSSHHQGIDTLGRDLLVEARSADGLVEAFSHPDYRFCVGVQWHPEMEAAPEDALIIRAFISACSKG